MGDLGTRFRLARESKNVSLQQAEQDTRIRRKYLQALEDEDMATLPPAVYARGFVRNYASYLGLDPNGMLALYHEAIGQAPAAKPETAAGEGAAPQRPSPPPPTPPSATPSVRPPTRPMESRSWLSPNIFIGLGVLLVVILAAYFLLTSSAYQDLVGPATPSLASPIFYTRVPASATALATESPTVGVFGETPTSTPIPSIEVEIRALPDSYGCWLEVYVDGREDFRGMLPPGGSRTWAGRDRIAMHVGNAGGVEATVNGQLQGPLGAPGQVVDVEWTRPGAGPVPSATPPVTGTLTTIPGATYPLSPTKTPTTISTPTVPAVTSTPTPTRPPTPTGTAFPTSPAATPTP